MVSGSLVRLRAVEARDVEPLYEWFNDPVAVEGLAIRYPPSMQVEREWVEGAGVVSYARVLFSVETHDGDFLGTCGLFKTNLPENRCAELGLALVRPGSRGRGYGTDTVRTLCRFGFDEMNLHRIELLVFAHNDAARRVYEKCGFTVECVARQAHWGEGRWNDDVHMALLEGELR
jgi:RimJ/RimL family protein N-acetyltransferase